MPSRRHIRGSVLTGRRRFPRLSYEKPGPARLIPGIERGVVDLFSLVAGSSQECCVTFQWEVRLEEG
jgi:hypothetical protein